MIKDIIIEVERLAPPRLAESWDNSGLQVGALSSPVTKILLALDVTDAVIDEAANVQAQLIICHHPLIYGEISLIDSDCPLGAKISKLIKKGICVYAAHTNLDKAAGGVNDALASALGVINTMPLVPNESGQYKLVVFAQESEIRRLKIALGNAGAGVIGNYSHCTFESRGVGTFKPLNGATPAIGNVGEETSTDEIRLEVIVDEERLGDVIKALTLNHSYDEIAYDLYPLKRHDRKDGMGRIGDLAEPVSLDAFIERCRQNLGAKPLATHDITIVSRVAVCGGSGADLIKTAKDMGADILVTGDIKYHAAQLARDLDQVVLDCGHDSTEKPVLAALKLYLNENITENIEIIISEERTSPWRLDD